jgi:hypothetical protein
VRYCIFFLEFLQVEVGSDLTELVVFLKKLCDLGLVGLLIDLVSTVEFLDVVHQSQNAVYLLLVLEASLLMAAQVHRLLHLPINYNIPLNYIKIQLFNFLISV